MSYHRLSTVVEAICHAWRLPLIIILYLVSILGGPGVRSASAACAYSDQTALDNAIIAIGSGTGVIDLTGCATITLTTGTYDGPGPTALTPITGNVTIFTNLSSTAATITRSSATPFRVFSVKGGTLTLINVIVDSGLAKGGDGGNGGTGSGGGGGLGGKGGTTGGVGGAGGGGGGTMDNGNDGISGVGGSGGNVGGGSGSGSTGNGSNGGFGGGGGGGGATGGNGGNGGFGSGGGGGATGGTGGFGGGNGGLGNATFGSAGGGGGGFGGAVFVYNGTLSAYQVTFSNNKAQGGNGGISAYTIDGNGGSAYGGAIFNAGTYCVPTVDNNTFASNQAQGGNNGGSMTGPNVYTLTATGLGIGPGQTTTNCFPPTITLNPATLPHGGVGNAYSQTITASGGYGTHTFSSGDLPAWLSLSPAGVLSGTPTGTGVYNFHITATDQVGFTSASTAYSITVDQVLVSPPTLPGGYVGTAYSQTISASGGTGSYVLALTAGSLPASLTFTPGTGLLTGTLPLIPTTISFTITATDTNNVTGSQPYTIPVISPSSSSGPAPSFTQPVIPLCGLLDGSPLPYIRANVPLGTASINGIGANVYCGPLFKPEEYGVLDRTVLHAVEVFALTGTQPTLSVTKFNNPIMVCLQGTGAMLYRDANTVSGQKRALVELASYSQGGFTCASMPNAGTIILVVGSPTQTINPPNSEGSVNVKSLDLCMVTTRAILNLRASPDASSNVLGLIPYLTTLKATARQSDFLRVVYGNNQGWLSARYLTFDGPCGQ